MLVGIRTPSRIHSLPGDVLLMMFPLTSTPCSLESDLIFSIAYRLQSGCDGSACTNVHSVCVAFERCQPRVLNPQDPRALGGCGGGEGEQHHQRPQENQAKRSTQHRSLRLVWPGA